jgi:hypothetical protein
MDWRNGLSGMLDGATVGAFQSAALSFLFFALTSVYSPVRQAWFQRKEKKIFSARAQTLSDSPSSVLAAAFAGK